MAQLVSAVPSFTGSPGGTPRSAAAAERSSPTVAVPSTTGGKGIIAVCKNEGLRLWEVATGKELHNFSGYRLPRNARAPTLVVSGDGKVIATNIAYEPVVVLWDAATGKELRRLKVPGQGDTILAFTPDGQQLATAPHYQDNPRRRSIVLWEVATGKQLRRNGAGRGAITSS